MQVRGSVLLDDEHRLANSRRPASFASRFLGATEITLCYVFSQPHVLGPEIVASLWLINQFQMARIMNRSVVNDYKRLGSKPQPGIDKWHRLAECVERRVPSQLVMFADGGGHELFCLLDGTSQG